DSRRHCRQCREDRSPRRSHLCRDSGSARRRSLRWLDHSQEHPGPDQQLHPIRFVGGLKQTRLNVLSISKGTHIMIVNMSNNATPDQINNIIDRIKECGFQAHVVKGEERTIIGAIGSSGRRSEIEALRAAPGVAEVIQISHPFKLVSRQLRQTRTVVDVRGTRIGSGELVVIAGPCSVESEEQVMETAHAVKAAGARMLRGGAYKPRTSPYDFQGLGVEALCFLRQASRETGLPIVTEVMSETDVEIVEQYADMMQVGARNMQNF